MHSRTDQIPRASRVGRSPLGHDETFGEADRRSSCLSLCFERASLCKLTRSVLWSCSGCSLKRWFASASAQSLKQRTGVSCDRTAWIFRQSVGGVVRCFQPHLRNRRPHFRQQFEALLLRFAFELGPRSRTSIICAFKTLGLCNA